jgi:hypothetical protein
VGNAVRNKRALHQARQSHPIRQGLHGWRAPQKRRKRSQANECPCHRNTSGVCSSDGRCGGKATEPRQARPHKPPRPCSRQGFDRIY